MLSVARSSLVLVGCGFQASAQQGNAVVVGLCVLSCLGTKKRKLRHGPCDGTGCCRRQPTGNERRVNLRRKGWDNKGRKGILLSLAGRTPCQLAHVECHIGIRTKLTSLQNFKD